MLTNRYSAIFYVLLYTTVVGFFVVSREGQKEFVRPKPVFQQPQPTSGCHKIVRGWPPGKNLVLEPYVQPGVNTTLLMPKFSGQKITDKFGDESKPKSHIVVFCTSAMEAFDRRQTIRKTWMSLTEDLPITVVFLMGVPGNSSSPALQLRADLKAESLKYGDILQEDFVDTYNNLTVKSMYMLKFANEFLAKQLSTQWILKVDDDCYVDPNVLIKYTKIVRKSTNSLIGKVLGVGSPVARPSCDEHGTKYTFKWAVPEYIYPNKTFPNALSGSGYLMHRDVSQCLYKKGLKTKFLNLEDVFITGLVASQCQGLKLVNSPRFLYMGSHICRVKSKFDLLIHDVKDEFKMTHIHKIITGQAKCQSVKGNTTRIRYTEISTDVSH